MAAPPHITAEGNGITLLSGRNATIPASSPSPVWAQNQESELPVFPKCTAQTCDAILPRLIERIVGFAVLLLLVALVIGAAPAAQAAEKFCSDYGGVIDGNDPQFDGDPPVQITIDQTCTFQNWPMSNPLDTTLNFQTNDPSVYLIIFDNVYYTGNLACSNIDHKLWVVNSDKDAFKDVNCQDIMIPAETIAKESNSATATIGVPFTYTLTMPSMNFPVGDPSANDLGNIEVIDDLAATGVDLALVPGTLTAYDKNNPSTSITITDLGSSSTLLHFSLPDILAGQQTVVEFQAILNDNPSKNTPDKTFINTAKWWFSRWIDLDPTDDSEVPDPTPPQLFEPLPGESGVSVPMTIVTPNLVVDKSTTSTAINVGDIVTFDIDVQNAGGGDAWNPTISDQIPADMCAVDPRTTLIAHIIDADGTTVIKTLTPGTNYIASYSGCQLDLTLTDTAGPIGPDQHLDITYQTQLNIGFNENNKTLTNIAGATQWYSGDSSFTNRLGFVRTLSSGTTGTPNDDHVDSATITTALSGYYFEKVVSNLSSLQSPATTAAPGDILHYQLRIFNVDQTIEQIAVTDVLNPIYFDIANLSNLTVTTEAGYTADTSYNTSTGELNVTGAPELNVDVYGELVITFDIPLLPDLANDTVVSNQAFFTATNELGDYFESPSDDPYDADGVAPPDDLSQKHPTYTLITTPGPLAKTNTQQTAVIGEQFTYTITIPADVSVEPLYDVQIMDDLPTNLRFIRAEAASGAWAINNTGTGNALVLENTTTGIDIPAGSQAIIHVTVELLNNTGNLSGTTFVNNASYTYNRANGVDNTKLTGGNDTSDAMTVIEPHLTVSKDKKFYAPAGKPETDPATVGDVIEYTVTIHNDGDIDATAYDINIVDTLPSNVALETGSATASIGTSVTGFIADPITLTGTTLVWGSENGDGSLDLPYNEDLVLTYRVTVIDATSAHSFTNSVYVDWTSLDDANGAERTGAGCPDDTDPNNYCAGPANVIVYTEDNTTLSKTVFADSYDEMPPSSGNPVVRIGDTVTYDLTLNLQEYTTYNVVVEDTLPTGMEFVSYSIISALGSGSIYSVSSEPTAGDRTLYWNLGDVYNAPDGTPLDLLTIRYVARVLTNAPTDAIPGVDYTPSIALDNQAQLSYTGGDPAAFPDRLTSATSIEVRQPQMSALNKVDLGNGRTGSGTAVDPYQVNLANDTMSFELSSCNNGLAPSYNLRITDLLANAFDESSLTTPAVSIDGSPLTDTIGYDYSPPSGPGGSLGFDFKTPINPGGCVSITYDIGFYTDLAPESTWNNEAGLPIYASLPADGRLYTPTDVAQVWMTNAFSVEPLTKSLQIPTSGEATIGEQVVYQLTVPGAPVNAVLNNVTVSDPLHNALAFVDATFSLNGSAPSPLPAPVDQNLSWNIGNIPAGQQAVITLTARVDNTDDANGGTIIVNSATYSYDAIPVGATTDGSSAPLTIVEPAVTIDKTVSNVSKPGLGPSAGDTLRYTLTLTAAGGSVGDTFADAFDLRIDDSLSLGLAYLGTPTVNGSGNSIANPTVSGDGSSTPQTLVWDLADATADIDIPEGTVVTITYGVKVIDSVVAGQLLGNSASARWTGLDDANTAERTGSGSPAYNDYVTGPATTTLIVGDNNSLAKAIIADSYVDAPSTATDKIVRIGDTATYQLTLNLGEGTISEVTVTDLLPDGMVFDSSSITAGANFSFSIPVPQPIPNATGTLIWNFGDITNTPSNDDTPVDTLIITYQATVQPDDGIIQTPATDLTNTATLGYLDADDNPVVNLTRLVASDILSVRQPLLVPLIKLGNGATNTAATPLNVNVATDSVQFHLETCNNGLAPAYDVQISDLLATQFDENRLSTPVVAIDSVELVIDTDYTYTPPTAPGGSLEFLLNKPLAAGQCLTIDYSIGFYADFGADQHWNNTATLNDYWSLPTSGGQHYQPADSASFYLTNVTTVEPLTKSLQTPASGKATIGEQVVYQLTVPGAPVNAVLNDVTVSDTLHEALAFVDATFSLNGSAPSPLPAPVDQNLSWNIGNIPAGQQAVITLTARVDNTDDANDGTIIVNSATYSYDAIPVGATTDGSSAPLTIVEPAVTIAKSVNPATPPVAGDIQTYTVNLIATGGATSYDVVINDSLSLGLAYVAGSAQIAGAAGEPIVTGDGMTIPQTLSWTGGIDIPAGTSVTVTYDVLLLDTVEASQTLTNSSIAQWTSLAGSSTDERTGSGTPAYNDYLTGPVTTSLTIETPHLTLQKTVDKSVANPGDLLLYTLTITNPTPIRLSNFTLVDNLDALNAMPMFQTTSLGNIVVPDGASYVVSNSTLTVNDLNIDPKGTLTIQFEILLAADLKGGTLVLNQAQLQGPWSASINSDDPNVLGTTDPTQTLIPVNGVVYDSATRHPLGGVTLTMLWSSTEAPLPASCFIDPAQQNQVTSANGTYKFDLLFDPMNCPEGEDYLISATAVPAGYVAEPSLIIKPVTNSATPAYSAPVCSDDAIPATSQCEAHASATVPMGTAATHYLHLTFDSTANQIFNNHIPIDKKIEEKIYISKTTPLINVTRGQLVPYKITVKNTLRNTLPPLGIVDILPPGFKYVEGSSRLDESSFEPVATGRQLVWGNLAIGYNQEHTIEILLTVGSGVSEGKYVNQAHVINTDTGEQFSEVATATVRVVPDPTFDCTDVIGKVFDDRDLNGLQDEGEEGLAGVRVITARGLIGTTDEYGRFHIACAAFPDEERGSNFILKLDDRSLPTGYRLTTENPRVQRATRAKMMKFDFGATIHRVVAIDISDGAFEPESTELRPQWLPKFEQLLDVLKESASVLRLSYLADIERKDLVRQRIKVLKKEISGRWEDSKSDYRLTIESEVFWRRGRPVR